VSEPWPRPAVHRSVFAKLVLIMLVMALCLMGMVVGFFLFFVNPVVGASVDQMLGDYAQRVAKDAPRQEEAKGLATRAALRIRYEGPDGSWTTDETLPTIAQALDEARGHWPRASWGRSRHLVTAPNGGRYLFAWEFGRRTRVAHDRLLLLLLTMMVLVFLSAHVVLSHALRPLRALQAGVQRLSAGDLDVALENRTRDEFGALTDAFNRMAERVKDMVRARDQLLLDVSHELRSPLTRLKVALALLPDSAKKTQAEADAAEMEAMITELLEFERLRDPRTLRTTREDLVALLREAARTYREGPPGIRVSAHPPEIPADLDADGVRTILRNLLGNAAKYSLPDSREIELSAKCDGLNLIVQVKDDGPGIPDADLAYLFDPFFRVDRSRSRKTGGYGLGLSICKRIVEAHGGRIQATNNPGRGACFTLTFPARPAPDQSLPSRPHPEPA
jgi:signal transduction histidine kinase